ncbi:hypothetical protein ACIF85_47865 [Streptomyces sp. NPDC086033]|uniref:hypothetical protein n=1 Tax=Streptomyces sp. NPDC086033 TaxID=3365747 RepID=UPI0037D41223
MDRPFRARRAHAHHHPREPFRGELGVSRDKIRDASLRLFDYLSELAHESRVFSGEARAAPAGAEQLATERTPTRAPVAVTTPQLMTVIATNPGSRARHVLKGRRVDAADAMSRARRSSGSSGWGWSQAS